MLRSFSHRFCNSSPTLSRCIATQRGDFAQWYLDVIDAADLVDQSGVRGCPILKPGGFGIWEHIQAGLDKEFKRTGHQNAYFPLFVPLSYFSKEAKHVDGFAKECAVVTHHRLQGDQAGGLEVDPSSELSEPLVVRPTSETIIWDAFSRWISSHRDLPIKLNQWANVVRWELRTRPFLRTTEFLWQEGHTAHATKNEAVEHTLRMLDVYAHFCRTQLAMPVIPGTKSIEERFAGADDTFSIEAILPNGWGLQAGTSHFLGQNFAKAFGVTFKDEHSESQHVWATSWGVSTRLIGGMIMSHSDDTGLVLPPAVAPTQVVIVPISRNEQQRTDTHAAATELAEALHAQGIRTHVDDRDHLTPGKKFFEWEKKGLPLRLELGPRDLEKGAVMMKPRVALSADGSGSKQELASDPTSLGPALRGVLEDMQEALYDRAQARTQSMIHRGVSYEDMKQTLLAQHGTNLPENQSEEAAGMFLVPWHEDGEAAAAIQAECKATIRCYPFDEQPEGGVKEPCFFSGRPATHMALFGRAY